MMPPETLSVLPTPHGTPIHLSRVGHRPTPMPYPPHTVAAASVTVLDWCWIGRC